MFLNGLGEIRGTKSVANGGQCCELDPCLNLRRSAKRRAKIFDRLSRVVFVVPDEGLKINPDSFVFERLVVEGSRLRVPLAGGWTAGRDLPAPEGRTFMSQWSDRQVGR